ncbi:hypothetical protein B0H14DRAFT_3434360 [Mycena olivaceomarginata]|nr:hypothetical protein B0H14DRAFT_3434360 [Mycena olivaceomarginata]
MTLFANHATMNINAGCGLRLIPSRPQEMPSDNADNTQRAHDTADLAHGAGALLVPSPASPPPFAPASLDPMNTPTVSMVAPTGNSIKLLVCGSTSMLQSRRCTRSSVRVVQRGSGGELAGIAAAGFDARSAERQEQLQQLFTASTQ